MSSHGRRLLVLDLSVGTGAATTAETPVPQSGWGKGESGFRGSKASLPSWSQGSATSQGSELRTCAATLLVLGLEDAQIVAEDDGAARQLRPWKTTA